MSIAEIPQLQNLSGEEKLQLIDELWCSLSPDDIQADNALIGLLHERIARYEADPNAVISLDEFQRRWEARSR